MKVVDTPSRLDELRSAPQAIVFIHAPWSGPCVASLRVFRQLEDILWTNARTFRIDPDVFDAGADWLFNTGLGEEHHFKDGYGAVAWLVSGDVVDWEANAGKAGLENLIRKTEQVFSAA